ncbi:MAG: hypothetical protein WA843_00425 [Candidatus Saccharimonadales bacterium]
MNTKTTPKAKIRRPAKTTAVKAVRTSDGRFIRLPKGNLGQAIIKGL